MELKSYQQQVITDLELFLEYLQKNNNPATAFKQYWEDKVGPYELKLDGSYSGMVPYKNNIIDVPHIAIKVPTAGGKTFIACNAINSIFSTYDSSRPKAVVWLVPWSNLLHQTALNLSDASHPYRQKLNTLFNHSVEVYEKENLLQGANFNPTSVSEQLNIFVFNFSSLRINTKKKDDRKIYQQNGALEAFRDTVVEQDLVLPDTDESALINIIRSLNPLVIVDESHNAESDLSIEMLQNLNPSFILDLTATPKKNSNVVSYVNAIELKKEHMVKLSVIVYNHSRKEEVINSALHLQRQLEQLAIQESLDGGKKIRPIILFQAQSNIKGSDNTTYIKIKEKLMELKIPEEQIKIKVSGLDELKGIDLMDENCPVRYIITINALKEGWDCPFAYILASLADKSSAVEVEQILGRVLRQPYVLKHKEPLLNLSFVLTASAKFNETLDNIVKGLQDAGFSNKDYYAEEIIIPEETKPISEKEILARELFGSPVNENQSESFDDNDITKINIDAIPFDPTEKDFKPIVNSPLDLMTKKAIIDGNEFETRLATDTGDSTEYLLREMGKEPKRYKIVEHFHQVAESIELPQFYKKLDENILSQELVFEELSQGEVFLNRDQLLKNFKLSSKDIEIDFNSVSADIVKVDFDEKRKDTIISKFSVQAKKMLIDSIVAKPKERQVKEITSIMVSKIGNMTPIPEQEIKKYIERIFSEFSTEEIIDVANNEFPYIAKIKAKITELSNQHAKEEFKKLLDTNKIIVKPSFKFKETLIHTKEGSKIDKSLYEREGDMNTFEQSLIMEVASFENILFWHRNTATKDKGFYLNGFSTNHYPDFILYTKLGNIILVETKGDFLDNDDSKAKNVLGKKWAEKAGDNFKYFMVFETKNVEGCYSAKTFLEIIGELYEDHSAKTFNRPQWNKLLLGLKKQKNKSDLVLFTKWDRFSRNAGDAYQMISILRKIGVEPQAIEQPLDLSIPENKMMLAFYLAAPEVENDRRALNTFHGMRRAKKEGRYMGAAPFGYANKSKEDGTKYIALVEPAASVMRWIFEELSRGIFNTEQVYHLAVRRGFKRTKSNMWGLIRNPIYCGKIFIPKYKDEESRLVTGQHEPLISEGLFYNVQDILDGKSRIYRPKIKTVVEFPLRGFFVCPKCQKKLQGSKCKGRHKHYYYYHCEAQCKYRINSEVANNLFIENLEKYKPIAEVKKLYISLLYETHRELADNARERKRRLAEQIKDYEVRLGNARDLLLSLKIDPEDYKIMKDDYGERITNLERELSEVVNDKHSIEELLNRGIEKLISLNDTYVDRDLADKRSLIGLIYPENFTIRENKIQTARVNKIIESIYLINSELNRKKNGTKDDFYLLSRRVTSTGFKPVTF